MTSADHYDSDQALDSILQAGEAEELNRIQTGLDLDTGLASISRPDSYERPPFADGEYSGEPHILTELSSHPESSLFRVGRAQHCVLFAVDVAGFVDHRENNARVLLSKTLFEILTSAFMDSKIRWNSCYREDRGDGVLVIIPAPIPSATVIGLLLDRLRTGLRRYNRTASLNYRIRLRTAVHCGTVHTDQYGVSGRAIVHIFRLLDAPVLKKALTESRSELALIASDPFYKDVIHQRHGIIRPERFLPAMVEIKETLTLGWLYLPQSPARVLRRPRPRPHVKGLRETLDSGTHMTGMHTVATHMTGTPENGQGPAEPGATPEALSFRWVR